MSSGTKILLTGATGYMYVPSILKARGIEADIENLVVARF